jgi:CelD/BcsL family acetyltransferase involved in cellulose biosynthesis
LVQYPARGRRFSLSWLSIPDNQEADLICAPEDSETVAFGFGYWLRSFSPRWSKLLLDQVRSTSPTIPALLAAFKAHGMPVARSGSSRNLAIGLGKDWETYYQTRSRRLKKGNNSIANRLQRAGMVEIKRLIDNELDQEVEETIIALSKGSWKHETGATFDYPAPKAFLNSLFQHGREGNWLVVWLLTLDGEPLASELHIEFKGRAHALRADFAEKAAHLSPGAYLNWKIIERQFNSNLHRYELGPGDNPYKQRWTDEEITLMGIEAWPPTWRGRVKALWSLYLRPALARLKQRLQDCRPVGALRKRP